MFEPKPKYELLENALRIADTDIPLQFALMDVIEIADMLILMMIQSVAYFPSKHVIGISLPEKRISWQLTSLACRSTIEGRLPGIKNRNGRLYLNNWCANDLALDPYTGEILEKGELGKLKH